MYSPRELICSSISHPNSTTTCHKNRGF